MQGLVRYFDEVTEETKPTRFVCKNCGAEGDHKTSECRVQIVRISLVNSMHSCFLAHSILQVSNLRRSQ